MACKLGWCRSVFALCRFVRINFEHELMAKRVAIAERRCITGTSLFSSNSSLTDPTAARYLHSIDLNQLVEDARRQLGYARVWTGSLRKVQD